MNTHVVTIKRTRTSPDAYVFEIDGQSTGRRWFRTDAEASRAGQEFVDHLTEDVLEANRGRDTEYGHWGERHVD